MRRKRRRKEEERTFERIIEEKEVWVFFGGFFNQFVDEERVTHQALARLDEQMR